MYSYRLRAIKYWTSSHWAFEQITLLNHRASSYRAIANWNHEALITQSSRRVTKPSNLKPPNHRDTATNTNNNVGDASANAFSDEDAKKILSPREDNPRTYQSPTKLSNPADASEWIWWSIRVLLFITLRTFFSQRSSDAWRRTLSLSKIKSPHGYMENTRERRGVRYRRKSW